MEIHYRPFFSARFFIMDRMGFYINEKSLPAWIEPMPRRCLSPQGNGAHLTSCDIKVTYKGAQTKNITPP
jgi:hypothetical protein